MRSLPIALPNQLVTCHFGHDLLFLPGWFALYHILAGLDGGIAQRKEQFGGVERRGEKEETEAVDRHQIETCAVPQTNTQVHCPAMYPPGSDGVACAYKQPISVPSRSYCYLVPPFSFNTTLRLRSASPSSFFFSSSSFFFVCVSPPHLASCWESSPSAQRRRELSILRQSS